MGHELLFSGTLLVGVAVIITAVSVSIIVVGWTKKGHFFYRHVRNGMAGVSVCAVIVTAASWVRFIGEHARPTAALILLTAVTAAAVLVWVFSLFVARPKH